ncbi:MAG: hypothetical protein MK110_04670 [Fuerstiella sp.]|nr:hypothetical protein [Fuerstiella sp.]
MKNLTALLVILSCCTGCQSILHELQPHRLWRMNYTDAAGRSDGTFLSINDPLDVPLNVIPESGSE